MFKRELLKKMKTYAEPLGILIEDINFSHKIWETPSFQDEQQETADPNKPDLSGFDPDEIELDKDEVDAIKASVEKNTFASVQQRERMLETIIRDLKIQKFLAHRKP